MSEFQLLLWFVEMVKPGGAWDYKNRFNDPNWIGDEVRGFKRYERFGNLHFGAIGIAAGYSADFLKLGAGFAQWGDDIRETRLPRELLPIFSPYFSDDPRDQHDIQLGIDYTRNHGYPR